MTVGHSEGGMPKTFKLFPCAISIVTGESGSGKSMFSMWSAWNFMHPPCGHATCGGHVFSNVVVAQLQPDGTWDDRKHPDRYHYCEAWSEFFARLSEVLVKDPTAHCMLVIDEAANSLSAYDWQSETAQILRATGTLKRKWGELHIMILSMRQSLILKSIREMGEEGGLLDMKFMKDTWAVERYGGFLLNQAYDRKEIVVLSRPELEEPEAFTFTFSEQLAKPTLLCKPGDYAYATLAQATWGLGLHPHTEKGRWSWQQFIAIQSGIWPDQIPRLMYDYWHGDPSKVSKVEVPEVDINGPGEDFKPESREEKLAKVAESAQRASTQKGGVVREVERLLLERGSGANLSQIAREVSPPVTQQFVSQTRKRLSAEGKL